MRRMLIFIAGTKGGVGKSFASAMLAGAAEDLGLSLTVYDTDNENRTLATLMKEHCRFLDEQKETYPLDEVINSLYESSPVTVTIVDMKAGTSRSTQEWFSSVPWDALRKIDVDVYVAGCVTSDPDSVRTFGPWLEYFHNIDFPCRKYKESQYILIVFSVKCYSVKHCLTIKYFSSYLQYIKIQLSYNIQYINRLAGRKNPPQRQELSRNFHYFVQSNKKQ